MVGDPDGWANVEPTPGQFVIRSVTNDRCEITLGQVVGLLFVQRFNCRHCQVVTGTLGRTKLRGQLGSPSGQQFPHYATLVRWPDQALPEALVRVVERVRVET